MPVKPEGPPSWARKPGVWKYGGTLDKQTTATELEQTYAYQHYIEIQTGRGSAYTTDYGTQVWAENIAMARAFSGLSRATERMAANALPASAHEALDGWVDRLGVTITDLDNWDAIRLACASRFKLARGPTRANEDAAIAELLGPAFVAVWRQEGATLAAPPTLTYWPTANPGPDSYALTIDQNGNKRAWLSEREHLVVEVQQPPGMSDTDFLRLVNVQLFELLDSMLPSTATFDWSMSVGTGFLLDIDQLDFDGMD